MARVSASDSCPETEQLEAMAVGVLGKREASALNAHMVGCVSCQIRLQQVQSALQRESELLAELGSTKRATHSRKLRAVHRLRKTIEGRESGRQMGVENGDD